MRNQIFSPFSILVKKFGYSAIALEIDRFDRHDHITNPNLEDIIAVDTWARQTVLELVSAS